MPHKNNPQKKRAKKPVTPKTAETKPEAASAVVFRNQDLKGLIVWLNVPLHSEQARARNRIVELIEKEYDRFEQDRLTLLDSHKVMKDGKPVLEKHPDGKDHFKIKDQKKWDIEWGKLESAEVAFDVLPSNRASWRIVRDLIANTKVEMDTEMTKWWEMILNAMSKV